MNKTTIVYIKAGKINEPTGGGIEAAKIRLSLQAFADTRCNVKLLVCSQDENAYKRIVNMKKHRWRDLFARVFGHSSYVYIPWRFGALKRAIVRSKPTVVILGNSKLGFMAAPIKRFLPNTKVLIHYDNVEYDYVNAAYADENGWVKCIQKLWEKVVVYRDEKAAVRHGDAHLLLTERDRLRVQTLYQTELRNTVLLPVCLSREPVTLPQDPHGRFHLFFVGSLWYGSNVQALESFLANDWDMIKRRFPNIWLTVAGSRPNQSLCDRLANRHRIRFFPDYEDASVFLYEKGAYLAPIITGAGMKIKVAEALSLGLPVLASKESLVGYEEAMSDPKSCHVIFRIQDQNDTMDALEHLQNMDRIEQSKHARALFDTYYSISRAKQTICGWLDKNGKEPIL